jgi:hypothetical protein
MSLLTVAVVCSALCGAEVPESYIARVERALELARQDLPITSKIADDAASCLIAGGRLWATGQPALISEFTGRAGGFMMIKDGRGKEMSRNDVIIHFDGDGAGVPPEGAAMAITIGSNGSIKNHAEETALSQSLANAVAGWVFTGEFIAAVTRRGKMPVIYESIGAYTGNARIQQFKNGEVAYHEDMKILPAPAGLIGGKYVDIITAMLRRVDAEERDKLGQAASLVRQAKDANKALYMYSMGHLFPLEIEQTELGKMFKSAVWNAGFRMSPPPNDTYNAGDLAVHIGYQHPPRELLDRAAKAKAKVVYVSVMPDRNFTNNPDAVWIDPMWDWTDACVPLEGYDVPLCAASGVVNGAIAWEIYRLANQGQAPGK